MVHSEIIFDTGYILGSTDTSPTFPYPSWTRIQYGHSTDTSWTRQKRVLYFFFIFLMFGHVRTRPDTASGHGGVKIEIFLKRKAVFAKTKKFLYLSGLQKTKRFSKRNQPPVRRTFVADRDRSSSPPSSWHLRRRQRSVSLCLSPVRRRTFVVDRGRLASPLFVPTLQLAPPLKSAWFVALRWWSRARNHGG